MVYINNLETKTNVTISTITGQIIKRVVLDSNSNSLNIQEFSKGFYFVEIEGKKTLKLIKN